MSGTADAALAQAARATAAAAREALAWLEAASACAARRGRADGTRSAPLARPPRGG